MKHSSNIYSILLISINYSPNSMLFNFIITQTLLFLQTTKSLRSRKYYETLIAFPAPACSTHCPKYALPYQQFLLLQNLPLSFRRFQHIFNKNPISSRRIINQNVRYRTNNFPILQNRAAAHSLDDTSCNRE